MGGNRTVQPADAPAVVYHACVGSGPCDHHLPSHTRGCEDATPTHRNWVCAAASRFASTRTESSENVLGAADCCKLYVGFVRAAGAAVAAWDQVMHPGLERRGDGEALVVAARLRPGSKTADGTGGRAGAFAAKPGPHEARLLGECVSVARRFIIGPKRPKRIIQRAVDFCALTLQDEDRARICPHFREAVSMALRQQSRTAQFDPELFCALAEARSAESASAADIPNLGRGPLQSFQLDARSCAQAAADVVRPAETVPASEAAEVWYTLCMGQDCGADLPSQSKDCNVSRTPTHPRWVCQAAQKFVGQHAGAASVDGEIGPTALCQIHARFVRELAVDIAAYSFVMHARPAERVTPPEAKALLASQLLNDALARNGLRDGDQIGTTPDSAKVAAEAADGQLHSAAPRANWPSAHWHAATAAIAMAIRVP